MTRSTEDRFHRKTSCWSGLAKECLGKKDQQESIEHDERDRAVTGRFHAALKRARVAGDDLDEDGQVEQECSAGRGRNEPRDSTTRSVDNENEEDERADG